MPGATTKTISRSRERGQFHFNSLIVGSIAPVKMTIKARAGRPDSTTARNRAPSDGGVAVAHDCIGVDGGRVAVGVGAAAAGCGGSGGSAMFEVSAQRGRGNFQLFARPMIYVEKRL